MSDAVAVGAVLGIVVAKDGGYELELARLSAAAFRRLVAWARQYFACRYLCGLAARACAPVVPRLAHRSILTSHAPVQVVRNGGDSARLPTAHTCFNALLLPQYDSRAVFQERLAVALRNSQGFGLS